ncbi:hypothetical protein QBC45DRAFT_419504 [Copromyces sp. CBS 386.78]|nr:hypothetical protein QBC45DRAFT_419504 [Copromyces sp. CBS 386.78]
MVRKFIICFVLYFVIVWCRMAVVDVVFLAQDRKNCHRAEDSREPNFDDKSMRWNLQSSLSLQRGGDDPCHYQQRDRECELSLCFL